MVAGILSFEPAKGGTLKLLGRFGDAYSDLDQGQTEKIPIIHGLIQGSDVTLSGCYVTGRQFSTPGFDETTLVVTQIFKGFHFCRSEDIKFTSLSMTFTHLDNWMNQYNLNRDGFDEARRADFPPIEIPLDRVRIELWYGRQTNSNRNEVSLRSNARVSIIAPGGLHINELIRYVDFHIPNFLTLATGYVNYPADIRGQVGELKNPIDILYRVPGYREDSTFLTPWHMLFQYDDVEDELPTFLANWISKSERLWSVVELYFKLHYQRELDTRTRFLFLAQATEAYHRSVHGGQYCTKQEYKHIRDALIEAIPTELDSSFKDKLKGMIAYGYEYSLRSRIRFICENILGNHTQIIEEFVGKTKVFAHQVTTIRNRLTHLDGSAGVDIRDEEIFDYVQKMQMLLRVCFLVELGFSGDRIRAVLIKNKTYQELVERHIDVGHQLTETGEQSRA